MRVWWQNLPLALILVPLMGAVICSALKARPARALMAVLAALECAGMAALMHFARQTGESFVYPLGIIGAPFGNELRAGGIEALAGLAFALVTLLSVLGGWRSLTREVAPNRQHLYGAMLCLLTAAMAAIVFTNDLFTAYVFIEISTIAACALICSNNRGYTLFAAVRYMIMNLLGSGLFLLGLSMLYCLTGHLLFPQLQESVQSLLAAGKYPAPLYLSFLLMTMGVAMKSALYPFHTWLPNAYSSATATSSAILSSLISKLYIFLLIKLFFRAAGSAVFARRIEDVLLGYAAVSVVLGSVDAIRERHLSRMVAYSSVAQIGYIFLGIALGTEAGMAAALFHILAHSAAKAMLFLAVGRLREAAGGSDALSDLRGAAHRAPLAGIAFLTGACSLVGVPLLGGFSSKVYLAGAGIALGGWRMIAVLAALAVSTALNVAYLLRAALILYREKEDVPAAGQPLPRDGAFAASMLAYLIANAALGVWGGTIMEWIQQGIAAFA